jgi:hypothetical protein
LIGDSAQILEKKMALWPEPEILAKLVSKDSLRRRPTSPYVGDGARQTSRRPSTVAKRAKTAKRLDRSPANPVRRRFGVRLGTAIGLLSAEGLSFYFNGLERFEWAL